MDEDTFIKEILSIPHRCYICNRLDNIEFDYMCNIQYEIIKNDEVKSDFIKKGFCNYHFWSIASLTTQETTASMAAMLIENNNFNSENCLICEKLRMKDEELLNEFIKDITVAFKNANQSHGRLCQPHFRLIMKHFDGEIYEHFSDMQRLHNEQLIKELKSFLEKRRNRSERNKDEETSWWRAVEKLVGRKGMAVDCKDSKG